MKEFQINDIVTHPEHGKVVIQDIRLDEDIDPDCRCLVIRTESGWCYKANPKDCIYEEN